MPLQVKGPLYPDIIFPDFSATFPLFYTVNSTTLLSYPAPVLTDGTLRLSSGSTIIAGTNMTTVTLLDTSTSWWVTMMGSNLGGFIDETIVVYTGVASQRSYRCLFTADGNGATGSVTKDTIKCRVGGAGEVRDRCAAPDLASARTLSLATRHAMV